MTGVDTAEVSIEAVQRRTVRTLVVSQAVGSIGITFGIATASLLAKGISGSEAQAGLAQTCQVAGTACHPEAGRQRPPRRPDVKGRRQELQTITNHDREERAP
jgi:hypothetical protein